MSTVKLYGFAVSPHVRAARIALLEKHVPFEFVAIGPDHLASDDFGRINPFRKMPALEAGDLTLYETAALMVYADGIGSGPALEPVDAIARAKTWQFVGIAQNYLYPVGVMQLYFHNVLVHLFGMEPDQALAAGSVDPTARHLDVLETALADEFLTGAGLTIADIYAGTMVDYIARTRDGRTSLSTRPKVSAWLERLRARESFRATFAEMLAGSDQV